MRVWEVPGGRRRGFDWRDVFSPLPPHFFYVTKTDGFRRGGMPQKKSSKGFFFFLNLSVVGIVQVLKDRLHL